MSPRHIAPKCLLEDAAAGSKQQTCDVLHEVTSARSGHGARQSDRVVEGIEPRRAAHRGREGSILPSSTELAAGRDHDRARSPGPYARSNLSIRRCSAARPGWCGASSAGAARHADGRGPVSGTVGALRSRHADAAEPTTAVPKEGGSTDRSGVTNHPPQLITAATVGPSHAGRRREYLRRSGPSYPVDKGAGDAATPGETRKGPEPGTICQITVSSTLPLH